MPKRILDSTLLSSPSLAKCSPRAQDAFPRFILLMDDFGCADANPRILLGAGWPLRNDVTERDVWGWLEEYVVAGMACLWTEKDRRWVHLTGWFGPHGQKHRVEYDPSTVAGRKGSKRKTPEPPDDLVAAVLAGARRDHDGKPPGVDREDAPETVNDSIPARETTGTAPGNTDSRPVPAYAVPDAVADHIHRRPRLASPYPDGQDPHPLTSAVLAGLFDRGIDAAPPAERSAPRVEEAIRFATIPVAVDRLAVVYANPEAQKPLTYHVAAIRGEARKPRNVGDLGSEVIPWYTRLTDEEVRTYREERSVLAPELAEAPLGVVGPERELATLNDRYRALAEAR